MAKGIRYSEEFKQEAVNQVVHHNYPVAEVAERLGISSKTLYNWVRTFSQPPKKSLLKKLSSKNQLFAPN